ncbi:hypothetical protein V6Z11_D11G209000 [Gossypium hirsutum]
MSARLGAYLLYSWRSIWGARKLIEAGMGWRIGNGMAMNIWNDVWVPSLGDGKLQFQNIDIRYTTVSDLINVDTFTWNCDAIWELFGGNQLKLFMSIPLVSDVHTNKLVWSGDKTGEYTVRSGYK